MDPNANLQEQRTLAYELLRIAESQESIDANEMPDIQDVGRLAELVLALDEWRTNGGFDPYDPNLTPQHRALARLLRDHEPMTARVMRGAALSLPDDYIGFVLSYDHGGELVGGIDPEGSVST